MKNRPIRFLFNYAHYIAVAVFFVIVVAGYLIFSNAINSVIDKTVVSNAQTVNGTLKAFRTLYTREVVEVVRKKGIGVSHEHEGVDGTIPLPATFSIKLGEMIEAGPSGAAAFLYSPFPFPWRPDAGLNDDFRRAAWAAISKDPEQPFIRVENYNGVSSVRFATADIMRESCVNCHNSHPDSPKVDWEIGDLRGLLEIIQPVGNIKMSFAQQTRTAYLGFGFLFMLFALGVGGIFYAYRRRLFENAFLVSELEKNNKDLHVLNDELQQFAYRTSHDLKAPLLSIQGLSDFIYDDLEDGDVDEAKTNVRKINTLSRKLEDTINSILDLTKAEFMDDDEETIDFGLLVDDISESLSLVSEQNGVQIRRNLRHNWQLSSSKIRIRQIIENLVSNGIKYACEHQDASYVIVETRTSGDTFIITVKDNGIGIPKDKLEAVFSMFARFHPTRSTGSGLGLYLVKKHLDVLGGTISVSSDNGTGFVIQLSRRK